MRTCCRLPSLTAAGAAKASVLATAHGGWGGSRFSGSGASGPSAGSGVFASSDGRGFAAIHSTDVARPACQQHAASRLSHSQPVIEGSDGNVRPLRTRTGIIGSLVATPHYDPRLRP